MILDCAKEWPWIGADLMLWRKFRPPRRLGTIPYRALVPRLCAGMASVMAEPLPIRCQSANPVPIGQSGANRPIRCQSGANPSPLVSLVPFLTSPELPILISSHGQSLANPGQSGPLGGRIQDNRALPILTKAFQCQCTANAV